MAEAGFFYNVTTQKPDRTKPPSAHTNISIQHDPSPPPPSPAPPLPLPSPINLVPGQLQPPAHPPPLVPTLGPGSPYDSSQFLELTVSSQSQESCERYQSSESGVVGTGMLSTPLVDYKHAANQSSKARAVAEAKRKSSSTSGNSSTSNKNAIGVDSRYASSSAQQQRAADSAGRSSSISSKTTNSSGFSKIISQEMPPPMEVSMAQQPFTKRNGRRYLADPTLPYPLPVDLAELHRQTLRTMLLCQVFNGPTCSPSFHTKPPKRVLEVACGTAFWSVMCHRHYSHKGHSSIQFTGLDIAPLAPRMDADDDMNWRFVQHDLRKTPLPFRDEEFSLIMIKDTSMVMSTKRTEQAQALMDEYLRILKPGGTLEIWDGDHSIRMLLSHAPPSTKDSDHDSENYKQVHTNAMGTYTITPQTPLATPQNQFLIDYNAWISKALETKELTSMPCTSIRPMLLQEAEVLEQIESRRLAIPLGEVRWEREGVGGLAAAAPSAASNGIQVLKGKGKDTDRKNLTAGQAALRRTALMTIIQMIDSLEPLLREASGKSPDEFDRWRGNCMTDLLKNNGTSWGECLEVGAWWARKKDPKAESSAT
ncbi:methyltransferase domain-containing protein [Rutstroemia sp. NJR-2017a WRK4]|nr:methyltransferase domain-containing protein [Rutstroemia sp. NJR-2017a WRK4]